MNLFYFVPQQVAIRELVRPFLDNQRWRVQGIWQAEQLYGLENVNFISIEGHAQKVPDDIEQVLRERGCIRWRIDDRGRR